MAKTSLETPSDPLRMLDNKNIHEMICTFPTLLPKLAQELVRRLIKTTHIGHDERNKVAGYYTVALGGLQGILAAFLLDSVLHELFHRKHLFLHERANAHIDPSGRFLPSWVNDFIVRALAPGWHGDFLGGQKTHSLRLVVKGVPHGVVLDLLGGTWTDESMMAAAIRRAPAVLIFEVDDAANNRSWSVGSLSIAHFVRWDQRHSEEKRPRIQKFLLSQLQAGLPRRHVVDASRKSV
jgi:hypothetical protein